MRILVKGRERVEKSRRALFVQDLRPVLVLVERVRYDEQRYTTLSKAGKTHKYILRVPSGRPKPKWRYYYSLPGRGLAQTYNLKRGARFSAGEEGTGHWEIVSASETHVFVRNPDGKHMRMTHADFAAKVNKGHEKQRLLRQGKLRGEILTAMRILQGGKGGKGQAKRVVRLVEQASKYGWINDKEKVLYLKRIKGSEAYGEGEKGKKAARETEAKAAQAEESKAEEQRLEEAQRAAAGLGVEGNRDKMLVSSKSGQGVEQDIRYRLVDVGELKASHVPRASGRFGINKEYPEGVQERTYHRSDMLQDQVRKHAKGLKPGFLVNTNPDAAHGPPIVTEGGIVLGGNSRTMTLDLVYQHHPKQAEAYKELIKTKAAQFGLKPEDVDRMTRPVLVRAVKDPGTKEGRVDLVRRYNESFTQAMDPREEQVARAKRMGRHVFDKLADTINPTETFDAYLRSTRSKELVTALLDEGVIDRRDADRYIGTKGRTKDRLNEDGRTLVSRLLLGKFVPDPDTLESIGKDMRERIAAGIPHMIAAEKAHSEYSLLSFDSDKPSPLKSAVEALAAMKDAGKILPSEVWTQTDMFGGVVTPKGMDVSELVPADHPIFKDHLAKVLLASMVAKKTKIGVAFRKFAKLADANAEGQEKLGGKLTAAEAAAHAFGFKSDDPIAEAEKLIKQKAKKGKGDDDGDKAKADAKLRAFEKRAGKKAA